MNWRIGWNIVNVIQRGVISCVWEYQFRGKPCIINDRKASFKDNRDKRTNERNKRTNESIERNEWSERNEKKSERERESFSRNDTQKYNAYVHMRAYRKYRTKLTELNGWLKRLFLHVYCVCAPPYLSLCGYSQFAIFTRYPSCRCLRCLSSTNTTHTHTFEQADNECTHTSIVCVCVYHFQLSSSSLESTTRYNGMKSKLKIYQFPDYKVKV